MGREERQALLHEGSGSAVMSAYVEVIFDNSDERFPTGKPELVLRRTIGLKKDEYSLDRKNATKSDVMNLLESAGFSRSNPYYIVPQGRVTTLTNMKDGERLNLLKEVAGTQVYEARRTESLKIMQETDNKRSKIDDLLGYIEERLAELEEEKEELKKYQEKDREHRCLQYTLLHREQQELQKALDSTDRQREDGNAETKNNVEAMETREQEINQLDEEIVEVEQNIAFLQNEKSQLEEEKRDVQKEKAKIELEVQNLTAGQSAAQNAKAKHDQELQQVQRQIKEKESELNKILPQFTKAKDKEATARAQVQEAKATQKRLFDKQARSTQYKSKRERDDSLRKVVDEISILLASRKATLMQTDEEITELEGEVQELNKSIRQGKEQLDNSEDISQTTATDAEAAKEAYDQLQDRKKEIWREQNRLQSSEKAAEGEVQNAERNLQRMTDRDTWQGIKTVRRIKEEQGLTGVYGTLGELLEVPESYQTAVEITAGQSLFHYVVDTDETAEKLLNTLNKTKGGRVSFMPLNRIRPKPINMPKASDAVPMLSKIQYDPTYEKAFQQVFGKSVICPNLGIAAQYARSHGVSAITPQGDRADRKGALTGGWHDNRSSRINALRKEKKALAEYQAQKEKADQLRSDILNLDQEITKAYSDREKVKQQRARLENSYVSLKAENRSLQQQLQNKKELLVTKQQTKLKMAQEQRQMATEQQNYETELNSEFKQTLTNQELSQLEKLGSEIQQLQKQASEYTVSRSDLESRKNALDVELRENLHLRLDQLQARDFESSERGSGGNTSANLKDQQRALKRTEKGLSDVEKKIGEAETELEQSSHSLSSLRTQKAEKQQNLEQLAKDIERHQRRMEKSLQKKSLLNSNLSECNRNIRDLGVLPEEAFNKYKNMDSEKAQKRLHAAKEALKKYSHVNKKAFEQYNNFTKQREGLQNRRKDLEISQKSIQQLIDHLDLRKDEAIERTFKQVSKEFATVFEKLVPAGKGRLIIQRKSDRQAPEDDSDVERRESVENYTGVGISVSFNSKHDEQQRIQQLSGGQKSKLILPIVLRDQCS